MKTSGYTRLQLKPTIVFIKKMSEDLTSEKLDPRYIITVLALLGCLLRRTGEARGPGYVQVEVLGGVYEHV